MGAVLSLVLPCHATPCWFGLLDKRWRSVVIIGVFVVSSALAALHTRRTVGSGRASAALLFQPRPLLLCLSRQEIPLAIVCTLA